METIPTPRDELLLTFEEYCARITPEERQAYYDQLDKGAEDFEPIRARLNALNDAIDNGWCPSRIVKNEIGHLNDVLTAYHVGKYPNETRQTLNDAEADLATWHTLSESARDAIIAADERAEAELDARRKARQEASARKSAIYAAAKKIGMPLSPELDEALAWVA
ncbi:hypothetical protein ACVWXN_003232 [Bradyrhizobium sp. i1.4.4]